ncbi:hypothetical protein FC46_GL001428 [Lactobacillus kalixensis DSM 16043]|uniref:Uncharacterized protein n=1 Tax=Lactobacillus kalixensis DSM 16043 TaxID=1423763 RepID=A0A0R1UCG3_9LACO|nr:hypothetical protein FC46_GL001428 [Lactobacillus kalixensis DSM 16043]
MSYHGEYYIDGELIDNDLYGTAEVVKETATNADLERLQHDIETLDLKWDRVEKMSFNPFELLSERETNDNIN